MSRRRKNVISLKSLSEKSSGRGCIGEGDFDIDTLSRGTLRRGKVEKEEFIGKDLIKSIERSRKKRLEVMVLCYNNCCRKIKEADHEDDKQIIFKIPRAVPGCPKYNPMIVLEYISENLRERWFDTLVLDDGETIYINWENMELYIEREKERKERELKLEQKKLEIERNSEIEKNRMNRDRNRDCDRDNHNDGKSHHGY